MNPMISIATFLARLTSLPRMVLYVIFQVVGATIGAYLIRASYGTKLPGLVCRLTASLGCWHQLMKRSRSSVAATLIRP
jgi:glycerol uptake facilitator-like aquaporin